MSASRNKNKYFLSVLCIIKDETLSLREWVEHYIWQGVDHFFIIDNGSQDSPQKCLAGIDCVTIEQRTQRLNQVEFLNDAYRKHRSSSRWMAICDADEFWYGNKMRLSDVVRKRDATKVSSIFTNWKHFGSMGNEDQPKSIRASLIMRGPMERSGFDGKSLIRTSNTNSVGVHAHDKSGAPYLYKIKDNSNLSLNHYRIQSDRHFKIKKSRGAPWMGEKSPLVRNGLPFNWFVRDWEHYRELYDQNDIEDTTLRDLMSSGYRNPVEGE